MITLISTHAHNDPRKQLFSDVSCELTQDEDFTLPAELAAHICDCQVAAISFHSKTKYFIKKGLAQWLGFSEATRIDFQLPVLDENALIIPDLEMHSLQGNQPLNIGLPGQIQFLASVPIRLESGDLAGSLTVLGVEKKEALPASQLIALEKIAQQLGRMAESKSQNSILINQQNELLLAESRKAELKTKEFKQELKFIAYKMHEDFAQTLAATKLYLEFAEDDQHANKHFLQISKDTIEQVIQKMRVLCKTISPQPLETKLV